MSIQINFRSSFSILSQIVIIPSMEKMDAAWIETPIGLMVAVAKDEAICCLEFADTSDFAQEVERLSKKMGYQIVKNETAPLCSLIRELGRYFKGDLKVFQTPFIFQSGTPFQKRVWGELAKIPYGKTHSYGEIAAAIDKPTAYRAVAQANGANPLVIVIPCHRVINSDGKLGGYSSGLLKKEHLLALESKNPISLS